MPTYTGTEIAAEARNVYLNGGGVSDTAILPIINAAYARLIEIAAENDAPVVMQENHITVPALAALIPQGGGAGQLPTGCIEVYAMKERGEGETDDKFIDMIEKQNIPLVQQDNILKYWSWSRDQVALVGATANRVVRIYFLTTLTPLATLAGTVNINFSKTYLAADVAARAAMSIGHNRALAKMIRDDYATPALSTLLNLYARKNQSLPIRRKAMRRRGF